MLGQYTLRGYNDGYSFGSAYFYTLESRRERGWLEKGVTRGNGPSLASKKLDVDRISRTLFFFSFFSQQYDKRLEGPLYRISHQYLPQDPRYNTLAQKPSGRVLNFQGFFFKFARPLSQIRDTIILRERTLKPLYSIHTFASWPLALAPGAVRIYTYIYVHQSQTPTDGRYTLLPRQAT